MQKVVFCTLPITDTAPLVKTPGKMDGEYSLLKIEHQQ